MFPILFIISTTTNSVTVKTYMTNNTIKSNINNIELDNNNIITKEKIFLKSLNAIHKYKYLNK